MTGSGAPPWLRQLRAEVLLRVKAQHSTQAALAARVGISRKHLSQVLSGRVKGSPELLDRIARAVGLRIAVVIAEDEPPALPPGAWAGRWAKTAQDKNVS
jgi:transcriptional regulator with XRE-family HTH domain